jgi:hypothetical protein
VRRLSRWIATDNIWPELRNISARGRCSELRLQQPERHALHPVGCVDKVSADGLFDGVANCSETIFNGEMLASGEDAKTREELEVLLRRGRLLDLLLDPLVMTHLILPAACPQQVSTSKAEALGASAEVYYQCPPDETETRRILSALNQGQRPIGGTPEASGWITQTECDLRQRFCGRAFE